jgi:hypothetical protein
MDETLLPNTTGSTDATLFRQEGNGLVATQLR